MTLIKPSSPIKRETATVYRRRALIVELHPGFLTIREKGRRDSVALEYGAAYECALRMRARAERAEKAKKKGGKR